MTARQRRGIMRPMSPEAELYARLSLATPFVLVAGLVYAIIQRYRLRNLQAVLKWSGAFVLGFGLSGMFVFFITQPVIVVVTSLPLLWITFLLARSGRFRLAGLAILGLCLPGAVWWGRFLVQDALDPFPLYDEALLLWWLPELVGVIMAMGLMIIGDRPVPVPRVMRRPPNAVREPMALGNALSAAIAFGFYPLPSLVAELVALAATAAALTAAIALGVPWPLVVLGGALLFMLLATELWYVAFPHDARAAWEAFSYVGHIELERWHVATGTPAPNTEARMRAWLRGNEERPETRWAHSELLAVVGRLDEARAVAERIETSTPAEEFDRQSTLDYIDWISGDQIDVEARVRQAETIGDAGSQQRLFARGTAAIAVARDRVAEGGDWRTPLAEFQREIGSAGWTSLRQDTRRQRMIATFLLGLLLSALFVLSGVLLHQVR